MVVFFFKQKTAYEMRISDWSSDVCSSDLEGAKQDKEVLRLRDISFVDVATLLARYDLHLERVADDAPIPGSYWGDCEAGLIGATVHARDDTPVHSLLHEACHLIVLPPDRKSTRLNSSH